ncbi:MULTISPECIES: MlaA family lipoprotein [Burkholderia]|uniref:Nucleoside ABC transporter, periplasmic nucleoside-binding protein n=1 Tax=Burkholderia singularis TaxID=1503053 RepID=A0A238H1C8_9BURK|nr:MULTISPECIES: VacJ family lipoprotein [Burkholderia]KVE35610.1 ABC transporter [Burkholderia sp. TSV86]SMF99026.1 Nucleoside ABC transporter, periplasmic nucleoside-binding protein [Burkholderia singularis]
MNKIKTRLSASALAAAALLSGCATGPNRTPGDPLEPMNRTVFKFNDAVDQTIAVPIAKGYQAVTPTPVRTAVSSFFSNLGDLGNIANNLLQLRITDATQDMMRVVINSVFGVAGLFDVASLAGLPKHHQDFGLTLARWGVPAGPYLVLPIFGPSSFRDGVGRAVDVRFNLLNYIEPAARNPMYVAQFISARSDLLGATDLLQQAALDKYSFVRDAYVQQRRSLTYRGHGNDEPALPNYGEPDSEATPGAKRGSGEPGGLPQYQDPGDAGSGGSPSHSNSGKAAREPAGLPQYRDPGDDTAMKKGGGAAGHTAAPGAGKAASPASGAAAH